MTTRHVSLVGLMLWFLYGSLLSVPLAVAGATSASSERRSSSDVMPPLFAFAQALFDEGEYYGAIGEFQRFVFFYPDHPLAPEAQLRIGMALFCGERWLPAFELLRRVARTTADTSIGQAAALWMAESRARGGDHPTAIRLYQEAMARYPGTSVAQRAQYLLSWSLLRQGQWTEARRAFAAIGAESAYHRAARRVATALDPPPELPHRSPTIARVLSIVLPGAAQIYTGQTLDGMIGVGVHGALIAGTTGAIVAGLEGAAGVGAFFTWGFYRTQMSHAAVSARDFNTQATERFIEQLAAQEHTVLPADPLSLPCLSSSQSRGQ